MATAAASSVLPFGISSHGRGLPDVDGVELMIVKSKGAYLHTVDGRSYVDYGMAMGACLVGHLFTYTHQDTNGFVICQRRCS